MLWTCRELNPHGQIANLTTIPIDKPLIILSCFVGREGLEPTNSKETRFTAEDATSYALPTIVSNSEQALPLIYFCLDFNSVGVCTVESLSNIYPRVVLASVSLQKSCSDQNTISRLPAAT